MPRIDATKLRYDGRLPEELRNTQFKFNRIDNKGTVTWRQGNTLVNTSINSSKEKQTIVKVKFQESSRREPLNDRRIYEIEQKTISIFNLVLKGEQQLEINVDVLSDDGSLFSAIINSITLACAHCGVPISDLCISTTANDCIDLCSQEEKTSFSLCLVFCPNKEKILYLDSIGKAQKEQMENAINNAIKGCLELHEIFKNYCRGYES